VSPRDRTEDQSSCRQEEYRPIVSALGAEGRLEDVSPQDRTEDQSIYSQEEYRPIVSALGAEGR